MTLRIFLKGVIMNAGKTLFAQLMDFLPWSTFNRYVDVKEVLVGLASHPAESGFGVSVTRYWKVGSVDYKRVPELQGVDLDGYRQKGRWETRVCLHQSGRGS